MGQNRSIENEKYYGENYAIDQYYGQSAKEVSEALYTSCWKRNCLIAVIA